MDKIEDFYFSSDWKIEGKSKEDLLHIFEKVTKNLFTNLASYGLLTHSPKITVDTLSDKFNPKHCIKVNFKADSFQNHGEPDRYCICKCKNADKTFEARIVFVNTEVVAKADGIIMYANDTKWYSNGKFIKVEEWKYKFLDLSSRKIEKESWLKENKNNTDFIIL